MQPQPEFTNYNNNIKSNSKTTAKTNNNQQQQKQLPKQSTQGEQLPEEAAIAPQQQQPQLPSNHHSETRITATTVPRPRVIKSKQPLLNFHFYLDIIDHQLTKRIEKQVHALGGALEFFLNSNVTHFVTDKAELPANVLGGIVATTPNGPQTPQTPLTQHNSVETLDAKNATTPTGKISGKGPQTRADAILSRARLQGQTANVPTTPTLPTPTKTISTNLESDKLCEQQQTTYKVWQTEYALRFFKKVQHELKVYLQPQLQKEQHKQQHHSHKLSNSKSATTSSGGEAISLKGGFIKIESQKRNCRPYYQLFRKPASDWPKIELTSDDGAFRLSTKNPNKTNNNNVMTRKSRSRNSQCATPLPAAVQALRKHAAQTTVTAATSGRAGISACRLAKESSEKQCGVCEICKIEYDTLTIHLKTKDHEFFAKNPQNFIALDTLIESSADVNKFLNDDVTSNNAMQEMEVEEQELPLADVNAEDPLSVSIGNKQNCDSSVSTPSPLLREKSKRTTKGKHSSEKFQKTTPPRKKSNTAKNTVNLSSPVRPLLPPSSLYKVVESTPLECTPRRGRLAAGDISETTIASPSLIVKFKKVRAAELNRLNGEAENFMFPKQQHVSSDLPTDTDRHSSSERLRSHNSSSSSLESSRISELLEKEEDVSVNKRRSKSLLPARKQSFQSAPIQPAVQLKRSCRQQQEQKRKDVAKDNMELSPPSAAAAIVAATAKITLPAATRKSSRTATAIVTAATTSSRLLRAAAEVVKKSSNKSTTSARNILNNSTNKQVISNIVQTTPSTSYRMRSCRLAANALVVKMEDRMGDSSEYNTDNNDERIEKNVKLKRRAQKRQIVKQEIVDDDEEDEDDDDDIDVDDAADEDFKINFRRRSTTTRISTVEAISNRRQGKRRTQQEQLYVDANIAIEPPIKPPLQTCKKPLPKTKSITPPKRTPTDIRRNKSTTQIFDFTKSERLSQSSYAFERVPAADLWYRVYARQDACEERYFEYYGGNQYHKLPYEMGPIPYYHTNKGSECCILCQPKLEQNKTISVKEEPNISNMQNNATLTTTTTETIKATTVDKSTYTLKHKKLHLLQRYRQEQEALQQLQERQDTCQTETQVNEEVNGISSKTCSAERELRTCEREGSTTSSCASSVATNATSLAKTGFRNKLLNKAAFLSLELPPRKSPREHASTLALVSCIIKQRQESKPNSDADEAISVPTTPLPLTKEETPAGTSTATTTHNTRSAVATPVEEMCFATEISENVKRMRRGRNKYDHSPPYVVSTPRRIVRQKLNSNFIMNKQQKKLSPKHRHRIINKFRKVTNTAACLHSKPSDALESQKVTHTAPSIRKTGQKKGVLEFSVDATALQALDASFMPTKSVRSLELEIDEFLQTSGKDMDVDLEDFSKEVEQPTEIQLESKESEVVNTPPATDYFSSDFDLCDLINSPQDALLGTTDEQPRLKSKPISIFNAMAMNTYYRKRKYMKTNRTGWPKVQKKKYSMRHQAACILLEQTEKNANKMEKPKPDNDNVDEQESSTVITPPDSESDAALRLKEENTKESEVKDDNDKATGHIETEAEDIVYDVGESIPDEDEVESLAGSVAQTEEQAEAVQVDAAKLEEDEKAVEADDEDEFMDAEQEQDADKLVAPSEHTDDEELEEEYVPNRKRAKRNSSLGKALANCFDTLRNKTEHMEDHTNCLIATTSTPTRQGGLRQTPLLNGNCNSPSERAGDNSDIFTVSSDGLDTDLDLSNSHTHSKTEEHHACTNKPAISAKSKKYDISKYVPNPAANTCAAEAATAAVKSLAIAQFLKKEVRVTCRRIRAPFRRFRYRR